MMISATFSHTEQQNPNVSPTSSTKDDGQFSVKSSSHFPSSCKHLMYIHQLLSKSLLLRLPNSILNHHSDVCYLHLGGAKNKRIAEDSKPGGVPEEAEEGGEEVDHPKQFIAVGLRNSIDNPIGNWDMQLARERLRKWDKVFYPLNVYTLGNDVENISLFIVDCVLKSSLLAPGETLSDGYSSVKNFPLHANAEEWSGKVFTTPSWRYASHNQLASLITFEGLPFKLQLMLECLQDSSTVAKKTCRLKHLKKENLKIYSTEDIEWSSDLETAKESIVPRRLMIRLHAHAAPRTRERTCVSSSTSETQADLEMSVRTPPHPPSIGSNDDFFDFQRASTPSSSSIRTNMEKTVKKASTTDFSSVYVDGLPSLSGGIHTPRKAAIRTVAGQHCEDPLVGLPSWQLEHSASINFMKKIVEPLESQSAVCGIFKGGGGLYNDASHRGCRLSWEDPQKKLPYTERFLRLKIPWHERIDEIRSFMRSCLNTRDVKWVMNEKYWKIPGHLLYEAVKFTTHLGGEVEDSVLLQLCDVLQEYSNANGGMELVDLSRNPLSSRPLAILQCVQAYTHFGYQRIRLKVPIRPAKTVVLDKARSLASSNEEAYAYRAYAHTSNSATHNPSFKASSKEASNNQSLIIAPASLLLHPPVSVPKDRSNSSYAHTHTGISAANTTSSAANVIEIRIIPFNKALTDQLKEEKLCLWAQERLSWIAYVSKFNLVCRKLHSMGLRPASPEDASKIEILGSVSVEKAKREIESGDFMASMRRENWQEDGRRGLLKRRELGGGMYGKFRTNRSNVAAKSRKAHYKDQGGLYIASETGESKSRRLLEDTSSSSCSEGGETQLEKQRKQRKIEISSEDEELDDSSDSSSYTEAVGISRLDKKQCVESMKLMAAGDDETTLKRINKKIELIKERISSPRTGYDSLGNITGNAPGTGGFELIGWPKSPEEWNLLSFLIVPSAVNGKVPLSPYNPKLLCSLISEVFIIKEDALDYLLKNFKRWPGPDEGSRFAEWEDVMKSNEPKQWGSGGFEARQGLAQAGLFSDNEFCVSGPADNRNTKLCRTLIRLGRGTLVEDADDAEYVIVVDEAYQPSIDIYRRVSSKVEEEVAATHGARHSSLVTPKFIYDCVLDWKLKRPSNDKKHVAFRHKKSETARKDQQ